MNTIEKYRLLAERGRGWVAKKLGVTPMTVYNWERGTHTPTVEHAKKVGELLGFDWKEIYEDQD